MFRKPFLFTDILVGSYLTFSAVMLILIILVMMGAPSASCQEVIMNQPSADVVDAGKLFVRSDSFYTQTPAYFFQQINFAYGVGHNCEISVNGNDLAHNNTVYAVIPGFKCALVKTKNFELYVGDQYWKPVANLTYHNGNVSYEAVAYKVGDWRFTAGSFQSVNAYRSGTTAGAIGGIEYSHNITKNWQIAPGVDYASGSGSNGYVSPGLGFVYKMNFFVCPGYMIGNPHAVAGAHQSFVMIGYTFGHGRA
jgi:hypothetical protein